MAIVDASQFDNPIILGQLELPGTAIGVAVDPNLQIAAIASIGAGVHLVDVSDRMLPTLRQTLAVNASLVEVADGLVYAAVGSSLRSYDLLTGELLQNLVVGGTLTGLTREGQLLFTMDSSRVLRAIDISGFDMVARGSRTLPQGGGKLFVGNGIAYAVAVFGSGASRGGFATADVSEPDNIVLISGSDIPIFTVVADQDIAVNGSGIGVLVGRNPTNFPRINAIDVMDVSDPANTGVFLTRFTIPGNAANAPQSVSIASGIGFVAAGAAGLQVVNYLSFDSQGQSPTVAISTPVDLAPAADGVQAQEGTTIPILIEASDDVQVRPF